MPPTHLLPARGLRAPSRRQGPHEGNHSKARWAGHFTSHVVAREREFIILFSTQAAQIKFFYSTLFWTPFSGERPAYPSPPPSPAPPSPPLPLPPPSPPPLSPSLLHRHRPPSKLAAMEPGHDTLAIKWIGSVSTYIYKGILIFHLSRLDRSNLKIDDFRPSGSPTGQSMGCLFHLFGLDLSKLQVENRLAPLGHRSGP